MKKEDVKSRLREALKEKGLTVNGLSDKISIPQRTLNNQINGDSVVSVEVILAIIGLYPDLSLKWLLKGEGDMLDGNGNSSSGNLYLKKKNDSEEIPHSKEPLAEYLPTSNYKLLPLVNLDVAGGSTNQEVDTAQYIERYIPFIDARDDDMACPVTNNSMTPVYPPGTLVQIRKIELWREYIEYGQVYVVDLIDGRRLIKQVKKSKSKDKVMLVSFNKEYDDNEVPMDMIYSMWLVISKYERVVM